MAEEEINEAEETTAAGDEESGGKSKKPLLFGGGAALLLALAFVAASIAVPSSKEARRFQGPFVVPLFQDKFHTNLAEEGRKRFLQMNMNVVYVSYEEAYVTTRTADPLYTPFLRDAVLRVNITKNIDQVFDRVSLSLFLEELREAVDPILFPVHVGAAESSAMADPDSGIGPGLSISDSTFRGAFDEHVLTVDGPAGTLRLDDGPDITFAGSETDLEVQDPHGATLFLDVSLFEPEFQGEVHVGVHGRVRKILCQDFLVQ